MSLYARAHKRPATGASGEAGGSNEPSAKRVRVAESTEPTSTMAATPGGLVIPPTEVVINSLHGMRTPLTQVVEGSRDKVAGSGRILTQPSRETQPSNQIAKNICEEPVVKEMLDDVLHMTMKWAQKLVKN